MSGVSVKPIAKPIGEKLLRQTPFGVEVVGTQVRMTIGNKSCLMEYEVALKLAAFLRNGGRIAKENAGGGRVVTVFADLTDANLDELKAQRNRDGTAFYSGKAPT